MCVSPGFGGQEFIPDSLYRIQKLRRYIDANSLRADIQVDGGTYHENVREVLDAGANVIVTGSAVFSGEIQENVRRFAEIFAEYGR
jgi:ribulose-phosphate 3-epimerase